MKELKKSLTKCHAMKAYWGSGGIAPYILDLVKCLLSHSLAFLEPFFSHWEYIMLIFPKQTSSFIFSV